MRTLPLMLAALACTPATAATATIGGIERLDPRLDALIPADAVIEVLGEGYTWSEGPLWRRTEGCLLFSDVPGNVVHRWLPGTSVAEFLRPSGYTGSVPRGGEPGSNGLTEDAQGHLVLCQHGDRRVARLESDGSFTTLADRYEGKRFNSPNDLVFHADGSLFFTDPPYGLEKRHDDPAKELSFSGVYRLAPDGALRLLIKDLTYPNGVALAPDQNTLYVAVSDPERAVYLSYTLDKSGGVGPERLLYDATPLVRAGRRGLPDGLKVDAQGNLFATGPGGVLVFTPQGEHLGTIATGVATANCGWGEDGGTLFITAHDRLCRIRLSTRGAGW